MKIRFGKVFQDAVPHHYDGFFHISNGKKSCLRSIRNCCTTNFCSYLQRCSRVFHYMSSSFFKRCYNPSAFLVSSLRAINFFLISNFFYQLVFLTSSSHFSVTFYCTAVILTFITIRFRLVFFHETFVRKKKVCFPY